MVKNQDTKVSKKIRKFLSEIGRKGGSVGSDAQKEAARRNGKLGGRPKGSKNKPKEVGKNG